MWMLNLKEPQVNLKGILLSLLFFCCSTWQVLAADGKISMTGGYFSINAKAGGKSDNISNPSAFRMGYQYPVMDKFELVAGYSVLLADFSGSDLGYGLDFGAHYYPLTLASDDQYKDQNFSVRGHSEYSPFIGLGFYQRQFQSVKNSYAGLGATVGVEKYLNKKINLKGEARYISLGGSGDSSATEMNLLVGIVYKL